jgi:two-component system, LytTR family, response regulator
MRPLASAGHSTAGHLRQFVLPASGGLFLAYLLTLSLTNHEGLTSNILSALASVVPLVLLSLAVRGLVRRYFLGRPLWLQLLGHLASGIVFALFWYWTVMVLLALTGARSPLHFDVRAFFPPSAVAWQLLQGVTFYCLALSLVHLEAQSSAREIDFGTVARAPPSSTTTDPSLSRYFIKQGEDIQPVDVRQIVSISGAGDYAEVSTLAGRHLARMTLAQFEANLRNERFIRVHRSKIVNLDRVARAEPAGAGRILLHMENGESVLASRSGSKLFRERVI